VGFPTYRKTSKYGSVKAVFKNEIYDSLKERDYAMWLESEKQAGRVLWWRRQVPIQIEINDVKVCKLVCDFLVGFPDGTQQYHEVKSKATKTPIFRLKYKLLLATHPDIKYKIIE
jgi:hypothetical protein